MVGKKRGVRWEVKEKIKFIIFIKIFNKKKKIKIKVILS